MEGKLTKLAPFTNKTLNYMANFAPLITNVCQSLVYDINIGLIKVVWEKEGMAVDRKRLDSG
jgi:hypothetical protein